MSTPPEAGDLAGQIETLVRELPRLLEETVLAPQLAAMLRSLIDLSGQLAARARAQETHIVETQGALTALSAQIARLERDLYGSRSEKKRTRGGHRRDGRHHGDGHPPTWWKARAQEGSR